MNERQPTINRLFPVIAHTLDVRLGLYAGQPDATTNLSVIAAWANNVTNAK